VEAGAWIAAPLAPGPSPLGALLVSLSGPTPTPACDAALVEEIAAHTRAALARLPRRLPRPAVSESRQEADGVAAVVRLQPVSHPSGGDVVELWSAGDGSCWLLVADACGADAGAAATALAVSVAARAISGVVDGPAALLSALDRALAATPRVDRFVTAVAARLRNTEAGMVVTLATAGHPAPFLLSAETASYVDLPADAPLNLRVGVPLGPTERVLTLGPREQLLFFTDGATDRAAGAITDDVLAVIASGSPGSAVGPDARAATADAGALALARISDALDVAGGPSRDDMTLALVGQAVDARRAPAGSPRTN
jgi:hypothetical protein